MWSWLYGSWIFNCIVYTFFCTYTNCNQTISAYHHWIWCSELKSFHSEAYSIQHLCDKVCQWFATGLWLSQSTPVSSTNKTDRHDITEILLKVALNTINQKTLRFWLILLILDFQSYIFDLYLLLNLATSPKICILEI